jgi:galactokinase
LRSRSAPRSPWNGPTVGLEVATGMALSRLVDAEISPAALARIGTWVEQQFIGVATGIMDQHASALGRAGRALHLRCDTGAYEFVPFTGSVLIFDTGVQRGLADSAFNARRNECNAALALLREIDSGLRSLAAATPSLLARASLPAPLDRRARHVVTETARVRQVAAALRAGAPVPGELLYQSHVSLRDDFECSCAELDWFVEYASHRGILGARLTGAGWAGCAIAVGKYWCERRRGRAGKLEHNVTSAMA